MIGESPYYKRKSKNIFLKGELFGGQLIEDFEEKNEIYNEKRDYN